jgi:hypothetical protein
VPAGLQESVHAGVVQDVRLKVMASDMGVPAVKQECVTT